MVKIKPYSPPNIKVVFGKAKSLTTTAIAGFGFTVNSSGTANEALDRPIDPVTGFWEQNVSSKGPRWLLHIDLSETTLTVNFAKNSRGQEFTNARQIGYLNNHGGTGAVFMSRIRAVFKKRDGTFEHFDDWEWLLAVSFGRPLRGGTSSDRLTQFDPKRRTIRYLDEEYKVRFVGLVTSPNATPERTIDLRIVRYAEITDALQVFLESDKAEQDAESAEATPSTSNATEKPAQQELLS
jgi:hypothetical protein